MQVAEWSKSEVKYGRRVLNSGLEGFRFGQRAFLHGEPARPFLRESFRKALIPAAVGVCFGMLAGCPKDGPRSRGRLLTSGLLGGLVGVVAGVVWETRYLAASVAGGAVARIDRARDEHWLERNPIDYA
ncbi:MAG TPA: hypothetical protein VGS78_12830 [Candidatus Sulfotelmatobacter sp.]|nr:hypothetical protein [Candidatus Sulfotelmatobacter sp.]